MKAKQKTYKSICQELTKSKLQRSGKMLCVSKGLEEDDIQKLYTTAPEQLTDEELLLSTFCVDDLQR